MPYEAMSAETVLIRGHQDDQIDAYMARPAGTGPYPGVVVIHHMPGWDGPTKEIFTKDLQCPLLGLFGVEDTRPSPDDTVKTKAELDRYGKTYEFHTYDNAGHAFFAVDRPNYRQHAAVDGWKKVFAWFEKYLH